MPSDNSFDIPIKVTRDAAAIPAEIRQLEQLEAQVKKTAAAAQQLDYSGLSGGLASGGQKSKEQLRREEAAQAAKEMAAYAAADRAAKQSVQQTNQEVEKATLSWRGMGTAIGQTGRLMTGIAGLGRAFLNPMALGIIAVVGIVEKLNARFKELEEAGQRLAGRDFLPAIEARKKAMAEAAQSAADYKYEMEHLISPEQQFQEAVKHSAELLAEKLAVEDKLRSTEEAMVRANIQLQQSMGLLTPGQAAGALNRLDVHAQEAGFAAQRQRDAQEVALQQSALDERKRNQGRLEGAVGTAQSASDQHQQQIAQDKALYEETKKKREQLEKEAAEALKLQEYAHRYMRIAQEGGKTAADFAFAGGFSFSHPEIAMRAAGGDTATVDADADRAMGARNQNAGAIAKYEALTLAVSTLEKTLQEAKEAAKQNATAILNLTTKIQEMKETNKLRESGFAAEAMKNAAGSPLVQETFTAENYLKRARQTGQWSSEGNEMVQSLAKLGTGHDNSLADAIKYIDKITSSNETFLDAIKNMGDSVDHAMSVARQDITALSARLLALDRIVQDRANH